MNELKQPSIPVLVPRIEQETKAMGFSMASDHGTGSLLRTLASAKPRGAILELGTGTGLATCWLLEGMDDRSTLDTVDEDAKVVEVARNILGHDKRVTFHLEEGGAYLRRNEERRFDLIFADAWPGKYWDLDEALQLLAEGGIYVIDDMLPRADWPEGHQAKAEGLIRDLEAREDLWITHLAWSTGIILVTKHS